jgi:hypothetical protein
MTQPESYEGKSLKMTSMLCDEVRKIKLDHTLYLGLMRGIVQLLKGTLVAGRVIQLRDICCC